MKCAYLCIDVLLVCFIHQVEHIKWFLTKTILAVRIPNTPFMSLSDSQPSHSCHCQKSQPSHSCHSNIPTTPFMSMCKKSDKQGMYFYRQTISHLNSPCIRSCMVRDLYQNFWAGPWSPPVPPRVRINRCIDSLFLGMVDEIYKMTSTKPELHTVSSFFPFRNRALQYYKNILRMHIMKVA